jgi:hypothetical protein
MFFMQAVQQVGGCAHESTKNTPCKAACTILYSVPDDEHKMSETCRREEELD